MGLLKFGNQTLNIAEVPDGHIIIPEGDYINFRNINNAYLALRSKLPVGVNESEFAVLADKGLKYDPLSQEHQGIKTKYTELETKLKEFSNIPKEFTVERWGKFVQQESDAAWSKKIDTLTQKVKATVKEKMGIDINIDNRFIPADVLETFNPDDRDAEEQWTKILDKAHTEQQEFIRKSVDGGSIPSGRVGDTNLPNMPNIDSKLAGNKVAGDFVGADGGRVGQLR